MIGWAQIDTVKIELTPTSISYKLKEPNLVLERAQIRPYLDQLVTTLIADDYLEANSTRANEERITELGRYAVAAIAYDTELLWSQLDGIEASFEAEFGNVSYSLGAVSAFGAAGYILWTLRGGVLMAAAMSQLPSWRMVDPLPVLDSYSNDRNETGEDDVAGFFD